MHIPESDCHDVVGLGFGPANLALAIALDEHPYQLTTAYFERQPEIGWHRDMLVPSARLQVPFLKDLATFRDPTSRFTFVSYLQARDRLAKFVNRGDLFTTRQEFHDYLDWAGAAFADRVTYGVEALAVRLPESAGQAAQADHLCIDLQRDGEVSTVAARNVVISTGLVPRMPAGIDRSNRVWHSSELLSRFRECRPSELKRVAVVGAGQSAAEVVRFLYDMLPGATVSAIMPSYGYSIADSTPFANEIFDPAAVGDYHEAAQQGKDAMWRYHRNTNYGVVDDSVIRDLYQRFYDDDVRGVHRLEFLTLSRVTSVRQAAGGVRIALHSLAEDKAAELAVDAVVCATGYEEMSPDGLLAPLDAYCVRDQDGKYLVERDYRLATSPELPCGIYLQGGTEHTHGISSSLLSNLAVRGGEIADSIVKRTAGDAMSTTAGRPR
jgi:L-ornithine N5-monooxygenase